MKTSMDRRLFALTFALVSTLGSSRAVAQERSASDVAQGREFFNQGKELRNKGDLTGALEKYKAAHALANTPLTGIELGRTYLQVGQLMAAEEAFLSVARIPVRPEETSRSGAARQESAMLAKQVQARIPTLLIRITGVTPDSVAVTIDGAVVPKEALAGPRLVDPGHHHVAAKSTSGGTAETDVDVKEAEAKDIELKIMFTEGSQAAAPTTPNPWTAGDHGATPDTGGGSQAPRSRVLEWSLLGGGAAVGIAGAVLMVVETGNTSSASNNHDRSAYNSALTLWDVGLTGAIVGAAAVAGGGILFAVSKGDSGARASLPSLWVGVGAQDLRIGGTW
jgi:hypothetical protein